MGNDIKSTVSLVGNASNQSHLELHLSNIELLKEFFLAEKLGLRPLPTDQAVSIADILAKLPEHPVGDITLEHLKAMRTLAGAQNNQGPQTQTHLGAYAPGDRNWAPPRDGSQYPFSHVPAQPNNQSNASPLKDMRHPGEGDWPADHGSMSGSNGDYNAVSAAVDYQAGKAEAAGTKTPGKDPKIKPKKIGYSHK